MATIRTIEASQQHIEEISNLVCAEHRALSEGVGGDVRGVLLAAFEAAYECKAFYAEDQLIGTLLGSSVGVWMALSRHARGYPTSLVPQVRLQMANLLKTKHELRALAFAGAKRSSRLLVLLGFHYTEFGPGAVDYTRRDRHRMLVHLAGADAPTIPLGTGKGVAPRYVPARPIGTTAH